jgi:hypothetical protein
MSALHILYQIRSSKTKQQNHLQKFYKFATLAKELEYKFKFNDFLVFFYFNFLINFFKWSIRMQLNSLFCWNLINFNIHFIIYNYLLQLSPKQNLKLLLPFYILKNKLSSILSLSGCLKSSVTRYPVPVPLQNCWYPNPVRDMITMKILLTTKLNCKLKRAPK